MIDVGPIHQISNSDTLLRTKNQSNLRRDWVKPFRERETREPSY